MSRAKTCVAKSRAKTCVATSPGCKGWAICHAHGDGDRFLQLFIFSEEFPASCQFRADYVPAFCTH